MEKNEEDLGVKLGSDDMVFWRNIVDAYTRDLEMHEKTLRLIRFVLENAQKEYTKAEEEFNRKV